MKIVIFGLTISSSWGNGHATIWRGLLRELIARGHDVTFFERDVPYYAAHRDLDTLPGGDLVGRQTRPETWAERDHEIDPTGGDRRLLELRDQAAGIRRIDVRTDIELDELVRD